MNLSKIEQDVAQRTFRRFDQNSYTSVRILDLYVVWKWARILTFLCFPFFGNTGYFRRTRFLHTMLVSSEERVILTKSGKDLNRKRQDFASSAIIIFKLSITFMFFSSSIHFEKNKGQYLSTVFKRD